MLWMIVFGIGSINKNFMRKAVILPMMGIEEIFEMCIYGLRRVIPAEISNESMDYCEWKNGYRAEAMIGVAQSTISKLQQAVMGSINSIAMICSEKELVSNLNLFSFMLWSPYCFRALVGKDTHIPFIRYSRCILTMNSGVPSCSCFLLVNEKPCF